MDYGIITLALAQTWANYGYAGLFAGSFLSALFIPLGADILFVALLANGFDPWLCLALASTGGWLGGLVIYGIGYAGNPARIRKLFHIRESQLLKQKANVEKYGSLLALFIWIPVAGDMANIALGFYRANRTRTFIFMFIGRMSRFLLWTILYLADAGRFVKFINRIF